MALRTPGQEEGRLLGRSVTPPLPQGLGAAPHLSHAWPGRPAGALPPSREPAASARLTQAARGQLRELRPPPRLSALITHPRMGSLPSPDTQGPAETSRPPWASGGLVTTLPHMWPDPTLTFTLCRGLCPPRPHAASPPPPHPIPGHPLGSSPRRLGIGSPE